MGLLARSLDDCLDHESHATAVDSSVAAYVTSYANGSFPTASPRQAASGGQRDAFIVKLTASPSAYDETYSYDSVGNLTLKGPSGNGKSYTYGSQSASCPTGALSKRHAVINDGTSSYCYDANGNMLSGGNRSYAWDDESRPTSISSGGLSESYSYDADGERIKRVVGSTTTVYLSGMWEETTSGAVKSYYTLNGAVVAVRESGTNAVTYLHGDHLGSVSLATNASGQGTPQYFGPWGNVRSGGISATPLNYTGQRLDSGSGLLYYHARYYDPLLARFVSADSVVPGSASGGMDGVALKGLTVDFHEPGFVSKLGEENGFGFWFQLSDDDKQQLGSPWGPSNPQALNRYSYVLNGPVRYIDPTGHINTCVLLYGVVECLKRAGNSILKAVAWATDQLIKAAGIAYLPSDPNRIHHIFGQSKHNWDKTGLSQAENERLITEIANDSSNYVSSTTVRGGVVETYERTVGGNTVVVKVFEDAAGNRIISDAWVK